jgi:hypothetical protein
MQFFGKNRNIRFVSWILPQGGYVPSQHFIHLAVKKVKGSKQKKEA